MPNIKLKRITGEKFKTLPCGEGEHDMCEGWITYGGKPLPPLLRSASPFIESEFGSIADSRSATITAATRRNPELRMMCRCGCHLEKLLAEQDRLSQLAGALQVGMPSDID